MELLLGLITGIFFGVLLQNGRVLRFEKQVGAMLFRDMTILKFMLTAIVVGSIGIYALNDAGIIELKLKATNLGANVIGGLIFGAGWAICGYCPGTAAGALGEGRLHAFFALLGMLVGAALYAEVYPYLKGNILSWGNLGKMTMPEIIGACHWVTISVFSMIAIGLCVLFEKRKI
ncbi:DUF6691 family protein [Verrucomicrobiota bacterium]